MCAWLSQSAVPTINLSKLPGEMGHLVAKVLASQRDDPHQERQTSVDLKTARKEWRVQQKGKN